MNKIGCLLAGVLLSCPVFAHTGDHQLSSFFAVVKHLFSSPSHSVVGILFLVGLVVTIALLKRSSVKTKGVRAN